MRIFRRTRREQSVDVVDVWVHEAYRRTMLGAVMSGEPMGEDGYRVLAAWVHNRYRWVMDTPGGLSRRDLETVALGWFEVLAVAAGQLPAGVFATPGSRLLEDVIERCAELVAVSVLAPLDE